MPSKSTVEDIVLQADKEELAANEFEIHGDEVELLVRNEEAYSGELEDLLTADTSGDELHDREDVVAMSDMVSRYQIHNPIVRYVGITTNVTSYLAIHTKYYNIIMSAEKLIPQM